MRFSTSSGLGFFSVLELAMRMRIYHPDKLPKKYYEIIGEITFKWSLLEYLIHDISRYYLNFGQQEGRVAFYKTGAREKITVLKTVAFGWVKDKNLANEIKSIAKEAEQLNNDRNNIVHGVWGAPHLPARGKYLLQYVAEYKHRISPVAYPKDTEDLKEISTKINILIKRVKCIRTDVGIPEHTDASLPTVQIDWSEYEP